ncbi:MAG: Gfo/Idh/MocA family protein [Acidimicrobiales bacterium]
MTLRVGFLGAGLVASLHARSLAASGAPFRWAGVHDPDRAAAERFAAATGAPVMAGEAALVAASDAVYVCAWTSEHPRLVALAAAAGRAVFCEKPLGVDLAAAGACVEAAQRAGVVNQVGLVLRASPALVLTRRLIRDPRSGRVVSVSFRDDQAIPLGGYYGTTWRADSARAGAGTLLEHSIHDLDLVEWLVGPARSLTARTANLHGHPGIEDTAAVLLELAGGAPAVLTSVWHDLGQRLSCRRLEVFCERARIEFEGNIGGVVRWERADGESGELGDADVAEALGAELPANPDAAFLAAAAGAGPAEPDFAVALRAHVLADAAYRSAAAGGAPVALGEA